MKHARLLAGVVATATIGLASLAPGPASAAPTRPPAPASASTRSALAALPSFYDVPSPLPPGAPGTIIKSEPLVVAGLHGSVTRIMYHSRSISGADIAVTGLIAKPSTAAPPGGYPVVAWAHGTTGIADQCAPSLSPGDLALANQLLDRGWLVTATDYEGLGTPGRHPYIVGVSEARGTLDSVRAARDLAGTDASPNYLVWGHSQGGHAAMFALHIADSYAPELHLEGVVAGAPPSQFYAIYQALVTSPFKYYLLMAAAGINAAYGDAQAPLDQILTPAGIALVNQVDNGCTSYLYQQSVGVDVNSLMQVQSNGTRDPFANPTWQALMKAQDPGNFTAAAPEPLLIIHGGSDEQIPTVSSQLLLAQLCAVGQVAERWMYPGQSHAGVIGPSMGDMIHWMADRFAGGPSPDPYQPTGQPDVQVSGCSSQTPTTPAPATTVPGVAPATAATPVSANATYTG